jgi:hypothetical protein
MPTVRIEKVRGFDSPQLHTEFDFAVDLGFLCLTLTSRDGGP